METDQQSANPTVALDDAGRLCQQGGRVAGVAGQVLRFQYLQPPQDGGKAVVQALESGPYWPGSRGLPMAMELGRTLRVGQIGWREGRLDRAALLCLRHPDICRGHLASVGTPDLGPKEFIPSKPAA